MDSSKRHHEPITRRAKSHLNSSRHSGTTRDLWSTPIQHLAGRAARRLSHADEIGCVVNGGCLASDAGEWADSWRRCAAERITPDGRLAPHILTEREICFAREPVGDVVAHAREEMDRLYAILGQAGYVILLCNTDGVAIHHRGDASQAREFKHWGIWAGGVWSELAEGTNGIGTCIIEHRPVVVHRDQHYRTRHTKLSCSAAPIFDATGRLVSVLDCSSFQIEAADRYHDIALSASRVSARAIEERLFRESFRSSWTVAAVPPNDGGVPLLIAVDGDQRVVGADRVARLVLGLNDERLSAGVHLSAVFDAKPSLFQLSAERDVIARLNRAGLNEPWQALIAAPLFKVTPGSGEAAWHSRPRIGMLGTSPVIGTVSGTGGGLPPGAARRVREYIDAHLAENIRAVSMAEMAGLSVSHFARAFKESFGAPPHNYLVQRRVQRALHMLRQTEMPLSEIAFSTGFSDQSHFVRQFRRVTGMTPGDARRNRP